MEGEWYVLVEAGFSVTDQAWTLKEKIHVGGHEQAVAHAREVCLTYRHREGYGRDVFRLSETSWMVDVTFSDGSTYPQAPVTRSIEHFRVSVAELATTREPAPAEPPEDVPRKGRLRRAFGG
ncbi:hypothetical protein [Streptomyces sp. WM6386]|uniref:hypothetical protein n=1 Tax=Streptomyces sp. WM6386 TaxID=1415558 RepID=UPI0006193B9B|nr:hypothetical protein [Streptomyces sp. WM6386]KKD03520.1 hypothetical protein TN53_34465 [Streptomyces sp. WM6386]